MHFMWAETLGTEVNRCALENYTLQQNAFIIYLICNLQIFSFSGAIIRGSKRCASTKYVWTKTLLGSRKPDRNESDILHFLLAAVPILAILFKIR